MTAIRSVAPPQMKFHSKKLDRHILLIGVDHHSLSHKARQYSEKESGSDLCPKMTNMMKIRHFLLLTIP